MMIAVFLSNPHDDGWDIISGRDITGPRIGVIRYDDGLVLWMVGVDEDHAPEGSHEAAQILAAAGYRLDPDAFPLIDELRYD